MRYDNASGKTIKESERIEKEGKKKVREKARGGSVDQIEKSGGEWKVRETLTNSHS